MAALNDTASRIMRTFGVHACTDVTGYGLLGHATEMAMGSGVSIDLKSSALPFLPGAVRLAVRGLDRRRVRAKSGVP
jgi:selenide,water dikinase